MQISYECLHVRAASSRPQNVSNACEILHFEASDTRPQDGSNIALNESYGVSILKHSSRGPGGLHGACRGGLRWGAGGSQKQGHKCGVWGDNRVLTLG